MADKNLPCWSFRPNWANGVLEVLEWKTSVAGSPKGAEQRRALRLSPRRIIEYQALGIGNNRATMDLATWAAGGSQWNLPLYWDICPLTADAAPSATTIYLDTAYSEFNTDGLAFIQGEDANTFEVVEIASVGSDRLNLKAPGTSRAWKAKAKVMPIRQAWMENQPTITRYNDNVMAYQCSFAITETNLFLAAPPSETYLGYRVFRDAPNETGSLSLQWNRNLVRVDNNMSIPQQVDTARFGISKQQHELWLHGRPELAETRGLLYWLRGRNRPAWVPTFAIDMRLVGAVSSGDTTFTIQKAGVSAYVNFTVDSAFPERQYPGRRHICVQKRDGSVVFAFLTHAVDNMDGTETLTVSTAIGATFSAADVKRISFLALMRLDQDRIEINHVTDARGVATSPIVWVTTPENRVAEAFDLDDWIGAMTSGTCGNLCEAPSVVRFDDILFEAGGYNPLTREIWASSTGDLAPYNQIGYRFSASSLAYHGPILVDNPDIPTFDFMFGTYTVPTFIYDGSRQVMFATGQVRTGPGLFNKQCIFMIDAVTGVTLAAKTPTGTGVPGGAENWNLFIHPGTNAIWMLSQSGTTLYAHSLDETTLQPSATYSQASLEPFSMVMDNDGNIWIHRRDTPSLHRQIWKFDTSALTFSNPYTSPADVGGIIMDTTRNSLYVVRNTSADGMDEVNVSSGTATGKNIPQPEWDGLNNLRYDDKNDVFWGISWYAVGDGRFTGINASDGSPFGSFNPRSPTDTVVKEMVNIPMVPGAGRPNAFYAEIAQYFDPPTDSDYGWGLAKIPICNIKKGAW